MCYGGFTLSHIHVHVPACGDALGPPCKEAQAILGQLHVAQCVHTLYVGMVVWFIGVPSSIKACNTLYCCNLSWFLLSSCRVHYKWRMVVSLVAMLVLFSLTTGFVGVNTKQCRSPTLLPDLPSHTHTLSLLPAGVDPFFGITLVIVVLMNGKTSECLQQVCSLGLSAIAVVASDQWHT